MIAERSSFTTQDVTETEKQATNCSKQWEGEHLWSMVSKLQAVIDSK